MKQFKLSNFKFNVSIHSENHFYVSVFMDTFELRCVSLNKIITNEN